MHDSDFIMVRRLLLLILSTTVLLSVSYSGVVSPSGGEKGVTISNVIPRRDVHGELMDVHDGNVLRIDGTFYWFGMGYGNCTMKRGIIPPVDCPGIYTKFGGCGFQTNHSVNLYASKNLVDWTFIADVLPQASRPYGIYFRPKVIFNKLTGQYVLWINYLPEASSPLSAYPKANYLRFVSKEPSGPYAIVSNGTGANVAASGGGDFTLFSDSSGKDAYISYDAWGNSHTITIEKLTPDFQDSMGANASSGKISPSGNEAPIVFFRKGTYYLLFGPTCCFCHQGSGSSVYTSEHPLGPWTSQNYDLNPKSGWLGSRTIKAQESFVVDNGSGDMLYVGDRWTSAPDHLKGHDFQYWQPLQFNDTAIPPRIAPLKWEDNFTLTWRT